MRKVNKTLRVMGYVAPVALTLTLAVPVMGHEPSSPKGKPSENLWSADGKKEDLWLPEKEEKKEKTVWLTREWPVERDVGKGVTTYTYKRKDGKSVYRECWQSETGPRGVSPCGVKPVPKEPLKVNLEFELGKFMVPDDVANPSELTRIDKYIDQLKMTPENELITVVGHTDAAGSDQDNMELGLDRARAVRDYIISQGYQNVARPETRGETEAIYPATAPVYQRQEDRYVKIGIAPTTTKL